MPKDTNEIYWKVWPEEMLDDSYSTWYSGEEIKRAIKSVMDPETGLIASYELLEILNLE